ncbi:flagellin [Vreelandella utahensis]|uniref:flagellin N-terminal helical domain-containing protein n=1 Tax=Vreelandella halophila TaxID=86177 RepID=UPI00098452CC|nr:flagellin [Halomonas utahensis]
MPQIINTNIASINAQRNLERSQDQGDTALERLSSGLRINSAADDAAGLAISTRFESQTQGLEVGIRNANDGVSLAQTAEGALGSMTDNLQRIRELALQSANATNSPQDRESLNQEVQELKAEIGRVSEQTNFNGTKLLDGSFDGATFQIGANRGETVGVNIAGATPGQLGSSATDGITASPSNERIESGDLVINGFAVPSSKSDADQTSFTQNDASAIAKATAINQVSDSSGVKAVVNETSVSGSTPAADFDDLPQDEELVIEINDERLTLPPSDGFNSKEGFLRAVKESINEVSGASGVEAVFEGNPDKGITLQADDGRNITLNVPQVDYGSGPVDQSTEIGNVANDSELAAAFGLPDTDAGAGETQRTFTGTYTLISEDGSDINLETTSGGIQNAGLQVGTFSGSNSGAVGQEVSADAMGSGDIVINDVPIAASSASSDTSSPELSGRASSAVAKAAAINESSDATGVTAKANETTFVGSAIPATAPTGGDSTLSATFEINERPVSVTFNAGDTVAERQQAIATEINKKAGQTKVEAEVFEDSFRLKAEDGINIQISDFTSSTGDSLADFGLPTNSDADSDAGEAPFVKRGSISLESAGKIEIGSVDGDIETAGFEVGTYGSNESGQLLRDVDISTVEGANDAITSIDNALDQVNSQRANLGSIQNRFESTIENQQVASENLQAANSRIRDADFAEESAELARTQTLQQAGISILSQANQRPQQVLQLLQG